MTAFVTFQQVPTKNIGSTPTLIFGAVHDCILGSVLVSNQVKNTVLFSCYLLREEGTPTPSEAVEYPIILNRPLEETIILKEFQEMILNAGDTLYAYTDYSENLVNTFVSYEGLPSSL